AAVPPENGGTTAVSNIGQPVTVPAGGTSSAQHGTEVFRSGRYRRVPRFGGFLLFQCAIRRAEPQSQRQRLRPRGELLSSVDVEKTDILQQFTTTVLDSLHNIASAHTVVNDERHVQQHRR